LHGNASGSHESIVDDSIGNPSGAVVPPISLATTFKQAVPGQGVNPTDPNSFGLGYEYSRTGNPTRGALERAVAAAESARYCVAFGSGSAATSAVVHLLNSGDHVVCVDDVYGGTQRYLRRVVGPAMGITVDFIDLTQAGANDKDDDTEASSWTTHFGPSTRLCWVESPTNPTLKLTDIQAVAALAREKDCLLAVDNTFCSPYFQTPLALGADLVVHSVTKYVWLSGLSASCSVCIGPVNF
jgi:cystathionine gamma-lyase